jgi:predicted DNA-binding transcriptional regulator AlpA
MSTIQLIQITPEELSDLIGKGVKSHFDELKGNLQPHPEQLLTRTQTAKLLQIDKSTLWHWTKAQKIISYGIGNRVFYKRSEIEQALIPLNKKIG